MTTMMPAPAGAEPDAVTLQIPAIPMTWEQASIMLDATFDGFDQALDLCRALETALDADTGKELSGDAR